MTVLLSIDSPADLRDARVKRACLAAVAVLLRSCGLVSMARAIESELVTVDAAIHEYLRNHPPISWIDESNRLAAWSGITALIRSAIAQRHYAIACSRHRVDPGGVSRECDDCAHVVIAALEIASCRVPPRG